MSKGSETGVEKGFDGLGHGYAKGWNKGWDADLWEKGWQMGVEKATDGSNNKKGCVKGWEKGPHGVGKGYEKGWDEFVEGGKNYEKGWTKGADGRGHGHEKGWDGKGLNWTMEWDEEEFGEAGHEIGWLREWDGKGKGFEKGYRGEELVGKGTFWFATANPEHTYKSEAGDGKFPIPFDYVDISDTLADFEKKIAGSECDGKGWDELHRHGEDETKKWDKGSYGAETEVKITDADGKEWNATLSPNATEDEKNAIWKDAWGGNGIDWMKNWSDMETGWKSWKRGEDWDNWWN